MHNSNKQNHYTIIVLYTNISEDNKLRLERQIKVYANFSILFKNVDAYMAGHTFYTEGISVETYFKLLIPYILNEYKKIVYLDSDTICFDDIACIYNYDIGTNLLGAVKGLAEINSYYLRKPRERHRHYIIRAGIKNQDCYFNAGVLLFNSEEFRNTFPMGALLDIAASRQWALHDQGVLNSVCENRVCFLPAGWNIIPHPRLQNAPEWIQAEHSKAKADAKIIHFYCKPWKNANYVPYALDFWKYAANTPFFNIIRERMERDGLIDFYHKRDIDRMPLKRIGFVLGKRFTRKLIGENGYKILRYIIKSPMQFIAGVSR
jgi:lipopolysaccharide biosynthesis glycosyltransferase